MQAAALPFVSLGMQAGSSILGGMAAKRQAESMKKQAENNAYIGRTRAIQTDTAAREGSNEELATLRTTLATNGQVQNAGTFEIFKELRRTRNRERRIEYGNRMQESYQYGRQADAYGAQGRQAMTRGLIGAAPSLFDLYQLTSKGG